MLGHSFPTRRSSDLLRNGLVVFQFMITFLLIVGTLTINRQVQFIKRQNLGFDRENLLYIPMKADLFSRYNTLRSELEASKVAKSFTVTSDLPSNLSSATYDVEWDGKTANEQIVFPLIAVDEYFLKTMGIDLVAGRNFAAAFTADTSSYMINETTLRIMNLGPGEAIGKRISVNGRQGTIIGVVQNFHFKPIQQVIEPLIMQLNTFGGFVMVRTRPQDTKAILTELELIFKKLTPAYPFGYSFLDEDFERLYLTENRISIFSNVFAALAIFIACLGLFGLSTFIVEKRVKEIAVRKVVGASMGTIMVLLSKDFVRLLLVAILLATPLSWYVMNLWLENYAYRVPGNAWPFIAAGMTALFIALLATGSQTFQAATMSAVKSLRTE